ncbi:MAG TPA: carboxypeptidase regulatory-like domain-containing protein [Candidatus Acidoferrales bacterium]|nr:carboxypeptidase regulatory-like domain-containing protein [Candidatus Acidoferrales bacterium]
MTTKILRLIGLIALSLTVCLSTWAQSVNGDLIGTVFDPTGAAIPDATVIGRNQATGVETTTKTTATGEYHLSNLPPGLYTIIVTASGFTRTEIRSVEVTLNKTATTNVKMAVASATETVEVTAASAAIDTTTASVATAFQETTLADLPVAAGGSGVINLSLLNAGVGTSGAIGLGSGPSVGGQRPRNNNFTIEGIDNNSGSVTGPLVTIPNDGVAEFSVQQNQVSPEFGHSSGGQFNQIVKSGTNGFHGLAYEYLQNRDMNAADNLSAVNGDPLHPRYDNNRFGGALGGPIKKNKLFFYGLYEYNPIGRSSSAGQLYAPTAAGWATISSFSGMNQNNVTQLKTYLGTASSAVSAASVGGYPMVGPGNASLGQQVAATAKPVEIGLLGISSPAYSNAEAGVASVDYNISDKDSLRGRFILNRSGFIDTAASLPVFFQTVPSNNYLVAITEYHTFSPTLTNEFRLGYNRYSNNYPVGDQKWPGLDQFPNINIFELNAQLGPDGNAPQFGIQNQYQATENLTWTKGKHTLKFGADGWKQISPQSFTQRSRGDYEWSYLSDYLFDYYPDYIAQRSLGNSAYYGDRVFVGFYANDTFKVTPNLTVNLGLRYEYQTIPYSERLQTRNAISNVPGLIVFQEPQPMKTAWMPRVGIAYSPGTSGRTSIRAGFGRSFDVLVDNFGLLTLPPQATTTVDVTGEAKGGFLAGGGIPPSATGSSLTQAQARAGTGGYVPDQVRPQSLQWNFGVQHVFKENYTIESRYLGTRGIHLPVQAQLNRVPVVNGSNALPFYTSAPSQATLNGLGTSLNALNAAYAAQAYVDPRYLAAGFTGIITSYQPWGNSTYHGWANQVTRRFSNGLQIIGAYTFSHNIDDSTAEVFSTYTTPRRPQNIRNLSADRASSALDHRHRVTLSVLYDTPWYNKSSNWALKNLVGNWEIAPIYTYQTGNWFTVQSGTDSNLNGDSGGDRAYVNAGGNPNIGSGTTALKNSAGDTVAFLINNPAALYVTTPKGGLGTAGRNTERMNPTNNFDATIAKSINITERYKLQFAGRFFNILNHPQYVGGYLSDVAPIGFTDTATHNFTIPSTSVFHKPSQVFSSNPRGITVSAKFTF